VKEQHSRQQEWHAQQELEWPREWLEFPYCEVAPFDHLALGYRSVPPEVFPLGRTKGKPLQAVITVDVVIPAFNEENCIADLLHDVMTAKQDDLFQIQNIYVISDASTDQTDAIVQQVAARNHKVKLIRKQGRKGKQDSVNLAFSVTIADVLVFLDADVRLASEYSILKLVQYFRDGKTALVQGDLVRVCPGLSLNPAKQAGYFDWILVDRIRKQKDMSWWSIDGRVMALSRDFYRNLVLPLSLADDQYIFYSCIQEGLKFVWAEDAIFYYGSPVSVADFSHQWARYLFYNKKSRQHFGEELIVRAMSAPCLRRTIMSCLLRQPLRGLMWLIGFAIARIEFVLGIYFDKYERGLFWTKSRSLKITTKRIAVTREAR